MRLILRPKTDQLHPNQVFHGHQANAFQRTERAQFRNGFGVFFPDLFLAEDHMNSPASRRLPRLHQHVDSGCLLVPEAKRFYCPGNCFKVFAAHDNVNVFREPAGVRFLLFHIKERGEPSDDAIFVPGRGKCAFLNFGEREEFFHSCLKE